MDSLELVVLSVIGFAVVTAMPFVTGVLERWSTPKPQTK
jgi:hypothetical protein